MKLKTKVKNRKVMIGLVLAIICLVAIIFIGSRNNIFADIITDPNSFGNDRVKFTVANNALKLTVNQLETNTPLVYPSAPFYYTRVVKVNNVDTEEYGTFDFASLVTSSQGKILTLSDTTKSVSFDINVVSKSKYLTFEIVKITKPSEIEIKKFEGRILSTLLSCPAGNPNCVGLVSYCLSSGCNYYNFASGNQVMYFNGINAPGFPLEGNKFLLVTTDHDSRSIEFARTVEAVKQDLGVNRNKSYGPTFFATGGYVYSKANAELVAKKLNSFGYKRILIIDVGWQRTRGSWDLNTAYFPDGLKQAVDVFHQNGIQVGLHTLAASVSSNNSLYAAGDIAKDSAGNVVHPPDMPGLYLVNYNNPQSLGAYTDNLTSNMTANGIDFAYLDGSEWFGLSSVAYMAINNEFVNQFASKTKIDFQTSVSRGLHTDKSAITDVWQTLSDTTHPNDIKYWVDNTVSINSKQYDSARVLMMLGRGSSLIPNFGWTPLTLDEDPAHYAYALSAAIASGAPLTTEASLSAFMTDSRVDKFQPIFKERLDIWNQISANSVATNSFSGSVGERVIQFDNDAMGVTLPKVPAESYGMNAGSNRRIFIDPWSGTKTNLKVTFSGLEPNTKYILDTGKKYALEPAKQLPVDISFATASETTYSATVPIDAEKNDYLFLTLVKGDAVTPTPTSTISSPPNPSVPTAYYTFPKGFSTLGVTKSLSTSLITAVDGLYVYQFDGPSNKWLMAPTDTFTLEPSKGYYVYNKSDTKTISLPYDTFATNSYTLTKGWNMLHSTNAKQRSDIKLTFANQQKTIDELTNQNIINPKVFIIDNDQSKDSCTYFSLLDSTDQSSDCSTSSPKKTKSIPASKAFWVYVK